MSLKTLKAETNKKKMCKFAPWIQGTQEADDRVTCQSSRCASKDCENFKIYQMVLLEKVRQAQQGNTTEMEEIIKAYRNFVYQMEKKFFIPGSDREDLIQEAFIGLYLAIKTYKPEAGLTFDEYVSLSIRNTVLRAIRSATQKKQMVLTQAKSIFDETIINIQCKRYEPEEAAMKSLTVKEIEDVISSKLSQRESKIIALKANGYSAEEIAYRYNTEKKTIDNALYRARLKIKKHLEPVGAKPDVINVRAYERLAEVQGKKKI